MGWTSYPRDLFPCKYSNYRTTVVVLSRTRSSTKRPLFVEPSQSRTENIRLLEIHMSNVPREATVFILMDVVFLPQGVFALSFRTQRSNCNKQQQLFIVTKVVAWCFIGRYWYFYLRTLTETRSIWQKV